MLLTRRALLASTALQATGAGRRPPNLLVLHADDHAAYVMGADGNQRAQTPNLDRLASEGTRFASHYCNSPVCTPSRQSFLTGLMPCAAGVTTLGTPLDPGKQTLAKQLKGAGYHTAVFGKMHFNRAASPGLHGFDTMLTEREWRKEYQSEVTPTPLPPNTSVKPEWKPFKDPAEIWLNAEKLPYGRTEEEMPGTWLANRASRFLKEHKDDRFALWVSFQEPHSPYDFPVEDRQRFQPQRFPHPRIGPEDAAQIPLIFRHLSPGQKQGIAASYYTSVAFMDRNVGRVLKTLRDLKLEDDTLVVYMPDHGYCLGQHGRFEKHCGYEPALRVPLLFRLPGRVRKGVVHNFTESVDMPHTVSDLLGVDRLAGAHGTSLRPYLEGRRPAKPRDHIFSQYLENEEAYIRTERYKYVYCTGARERKDGYITADPKPGRYERLYDLKTDPGEYRNVAASNPEVAARLRKLLLRRFRDTHPEASPLGLDAREELDWYLRPRDV